MSNMLVIEQSAAPWLKTTGRRRLHTSHSLRQRTSRLLSLAHCRRTSTRIQAGAQTLLHTNRRQWEGLTLLVIHLGQPLGRLRNLCLARAARCEQKNTPQALPENIEQRSTPSALKSRQRWHSRRPSLPARPPPLQSAAAPPARSQCPRRCQRPAHSAGQLRLSLEAGGAVLMRASSGHSWCSTTVAQFAVAGRLRARALSSFGFSAGLPSTGSSSTPSNIFRLATVRFILGSAPSLACVPPAAAPAALACSASAFSALAHGRHALRPLRLGLAAARWQRLHEAGPGECGASGRLCSAAPCSKELCMLLQQAEARFGTCCVHRAQQSQLCTFIRCLQA